MSAANQIFLSQIIGLLVIWGCIISLTFRVSRLEKHVKSLEQAAGGPRRTGSDS
jgi:hypothetical protein